MSPTASKSRFRFLVELAEAAAEASCVRFFCCITSSVRRSPSLFSLLSSLDEQADGVDEINNEYFTRPSACNLQVTIL